MYKSAWEHSAVTHSMEPVQPAIQPQPPVQPGQIVINTQAQPLTLPVGKIMQFDGGATDFFGTQILAFLVTACTFGICYPYGLVLMEKWRAKHTVLLGHRLYFNDTGIGLFGLWIKWWFLCFITLGIYLFWVGPRIQRWKVEHTVYAGA